MIDVQGVLFDLDGTLLNTIPDLVFALNRLRSEHGMPLLPESEIRPYISHGSKSMVRQALGIDETHPEFKALREKFLDLYEHHIADSTRFFPNIEIVLSHLEERGIPWGIVTNKLTRHTMSLLKALEIDHRPACIICGDSLSTFKPNPEPILYACKLMQKDPKNCLYVGDAATDVEASKAAGTHALVALYGYIQDDEDPMTWPAEGYVKDPIEILQWIK
jgi:2-phosphoglycolate phosphatase